MRYYLLALIFTAFALSPSLPAYAEGDSEAQPVDIEAPQPDPSQDIDQDKLPGEPKKTCSDTLRCDGACPRP